MFKRMTLTIVGLAVILPVAAAIARPTWASAVGLDVWNVPRLRNQAESSAIQYRELDAEGTEVIHRIAVKDELAANLVAGRCTLVTIVNQFIALNEGYPAYLSVIRDSYPGATLEEKMAWNVMDFAGSRLGQEPVWRRFATLTRLSSEFRSLAGESSRSSLH